MVIIGQTLASGHDFWGLPGLYFKLNSNAKKRQSMFLNGSCIHMPKILHFKAYILVGFSIYSCAMSPLLNGEDDKRLITF